MLVHFHFKKEWEVGIGKVTLGNSDKFHRAAWMCLLSETSPARPWSSSQLLGSEVQRSSAKFSTQNVFFLSAPNLIRFHPGFLTSQDSYKLWGFLLLGSVTIARTLWAVECCPACFQVCFLFCGPACGLKRMSLSLFPMVVWSVRERCVHKLINKKLPTSFCILFWCLKK